MLVKAVDDISNSTYADVGWYPDYIQTIYIQANFLIKS